MEQPKADTNLPDKSRGVYLKLGGITILLNGPLSIIALLILLAIISGMFYLMITRTGPGEWASGGLWLAFIIYWSAAAMNAAATSTVHIAADENMLGERTMRMHVRRRLGMRKAMT